MVSALAFISSGPGSSPGHGHCVEFSAKTSQLSRCLFPPRSINGCRPYGPLGSFTDLPIVQSCCVFETERKVQGITTTAAKYSSEDAAVLVEYTVALVEYTRLYKPYKKACDYLEELLKEREEDERQAELESQAKEHETEKVREAL